MDNLGKILQPNSCSTGLFDDTCVQGMEDDLNTTFDDISLGPPLSYLITSFDVLATRMCKMQIIEQEQVVITHYDFNKGRILQSSKWGTGAAPTIYHHLPAIRIAIQRVKREKGRVLGVLLHKAKNTFPLT